MDTPSSKRIKVVTVKHEEDMKKPLNNEDLTRKMLRGITMYSEDLNPQAIDWEKKGVPGNATTSAVSNTERKRNDEEAFDEVLALKKSIEELEGSFKFNFNYFI